MALIWDSDSYWEKEDTIMNRCNTFTRQKHFGTLCLSSILFFWVFMGCEVEQECDDIAVEKEAIINGETVTEAEYENVGYVLNHGDNGDYYCTGTVIDANWVLTTASCVYGYAASDIQFATGGNVVYDQGYFRKVVSVRIHEAHDSGSNDSDYNIALLLVDEPISGRIFEYNTSLVYPDTPVSWIGYGMSELLSDANPELIHGENTGVRRRGQGIIKEVNLRHIVSINEDGNLPWGGGDLGAPAFAEIDGAQRLIGLVTDGDLNTTRHLRIDGFNRWIQAVMDDWFFQCNIMGGQCSGGACSFTEDNATGDTRYYCFPSEGRNVGESCDFHSDNWTVGVPCKDGAGCHPVDFDFKEGRCFAYCRSEEDCVAPEHCDKETYWNIENLGICRKTTCGLLGGDCEPGQACYYYAQNNGNFCFKSDGGSRGTECEPDRSPEEGLSCGDGLFCAKIPGSAMGVCRAFCDPTSRCIDGEHCTLPYFSSRNDIGICEPETSIDTDIEIDTDGDQPATDEPEDTSDGPGDQPATDEPEDTSDMPPIIPTEDTDPGGGIDLPQIDLPETNVSTLDQFDTDQQNGNGAKSAERDVGEISGCNCVAISSEGNGSTALFPFMVRLLTADL
jgi:hypothetical protein